MTNTQKRIKELNRIRRIATESSENIREKETKKENQLLNNMIDEIVFERAKQKTKKDTFNLKSYTYH